MHLLFDPDHEKLTQGLNYFALRNSGAINKMKALKLLFFADRFHLRKYGRPVTGDEYFAMSLGPVASVAKDLADKSAYLDACEREYADKFLDISDDGFYVRSTAPSDSDVLSNSEIEALEFAWSSFGRFDEWALVSLTHAYPEWRKHRDGIGQAGCSRARMDYSDFFLDPEPGVPELAPFNFRDPFSEAITQEELSIAKEYAEDQAEIRDLWLA